MTITNAAPDTTRRAITVADWVEELRAESVLQGAHYLKQEDEDGFGEAYCCLGVACEISGLGAWAYFDAGDSMYAYAVGEWECGQIRRENSEKHSTGMMPDAVRDTLRLRTGLGEFTASQEWLAALCDTAPDVAEKLLRYLSIELEDLGEGITTSLAGLNDNGFSFTEIADVIESNPPGLFQGNADVALDLAPAPDCQ